MENDGYTFDTVSSGSITFLAWGGGMELLLQNIDCHPAEYGLSRWCVASRASALSSCIKRGNRSRCVYVLTLKRAGRTGLLQAQPSAEVNCKNREVFERGDWRFRSAINARSEVMQEL